MCCHTAVSSPEPHLLNHTCCQTAVSICQRESSILTTSGPNPLCHRDDLVNRSRAMGFEFLFPGSLIYTFLEFCLAQNCFGGSTRAVRCTRSTRGRGTGASCAAKPRSRLLNPMHSGGNLCANRWFLRSTPMQTPPGWGGMCGRFT